ncbi:ABC transporter substrate-binding protein [Polymorphobacter glacialis]|uniref:ABC transporter substrate-binding protein n=1 Tax=Sandarakinorhabdus glacialis TaxID=1614636 RepID=A0A917E3W0_9SPHN|nr:MlaD family protein [Polymorphobacter glacialis]GGE01140.1 ABC transporter substrate-binding protein [Polymorphobacter glacialis]
METRSNYAIVGAVVVAITVAMFIGVLWLARFAGANDQHFDIFYKEAITGLAVGSPVAFNGVPVGKVEQIKLLPETPQFVRVRISVGEEVPVLKGTTAAVEGVGFTGVSQISLSGAMQGAERITTPGPYGVPVIPPRSGGLGALLANAPELLNNVSKLTDRLAEVLDPNNRNSIANILKNTDRATNALADRAPEIAATVIEARQTLAAATVTLKRVDGLVGTTNALLTSDGKPLAEDLRRAVKAAESSLSRIDELTRAAKPGLDTLTTDTLPEANRLVRDLRDLTGNLGAIAAKLDEDPAGALVGGRTLPEYDPSKTKAAK